MILKHGRKWRGSFINFICFCVFLEGMSWVLKIDLKIWTSEVRNTKIKQGGQNLVILSECNNWMPKKRQFSILPGAQLNLEKEGVGIPCPSSSQKNSGRSSRSKNQTLRAKDLQHRKYFANANFLCKFASV